MLLCGEDRHASTGDLRIKRAVLLRSMMLERIWEVFGNNEAFARLVSPILVQLVLVRFDTGLCKETRAGAHGAASRHERWPSVSSLEYVTASQLLSGCFISQCCA